MREGPSWSCGITKLDPDVTVAQLQGQTIAVSSRTQPGQPVMQTGMITAPDPEDPTERSGIMAMRAAAQSVASLQC